MSRCPETIRQKILQRRLDEFKLAELAIIGFRRDGFVIQSQFQSLQDWLISENKWKEGKPEDVPIVDYRMVRPIGFPKGDVFGLTAEEFERIKASII